MLKFTVPDDRWIIDIDDDARMWGGAPQLVDLSVDVETRQRDILHEAGTRAGSEATPEVGKGYQGVAIRK